MTFKELLTSKLSSRRRPGYSVVDFVVVAFVVVAFVVVAFVVVAFVVVDFVVVDFVVVDFVVAKPSDNKCKSTQSKKRRTPIT